MRQPHYLLKYFSVCILLIIPFLSKGQVTLTQDQTDAVIGIDRKNWNMGNTSSHSQGYAHDFTLPSMNGSCEKITNIQVTINITSYVPNSPPGCIPGQVYFNIYYGCNPYSGGASCPIANLIGEPNYNPSGIVGSYAYSYGCPLNGTGLQADFGGNFSVDVVPVFTPGCNPMWQNAINAGFVNYEYTIEVTVFTDDISCSGTGCLAGSMVLPCNDNDPCTTNDLTTLLTCDGSVCVPCAGTPIAAPETPVFTQIGPICQGDVFVLPTTSLNGISGTWSPAENNNMTTTYTFSPNLTLFPCALEAMMTVVVNPQDNGSFSIDNFCAPISGTAYGIITSGGTFSFDPLPGDGATINSANGVITNAVGGTTYSVKYTTNGNCPDDQVITVTAIEAPEGTLSGNASLCPGECANFSFSFTGGTPPYSIMLNVAGFPIPPIPGITAASNFTVCYTGSGAFPTFDLGTLTINIPTTITGSTSLALTNISDISGCPGMASGSFNLTLNSGPLAISPGILTACADAFGDGTFDLTFYNNTVNGGNGSLIVTWYEDMAGTLPILNPAAYVSSGGTIYVGVSNGNCDSPLIAVTLTVDNGVVPFLSMLCANSGLNTCDICVQSGFADLAFNFNDGDTYFVVVRDMNTMVEYNGNVSNGVPLSVPVSTNTTFQLISIQNLSGCPNNAVYGDLVTINLINAPVINPVSILPSCLPVALPVITGSFLSGGEMYFTGPNGTGTPYNAGDVISASITLYIFDENAGCEDEETLVITINPLITFDPIPLIENCGNAVLPPITGSGVGVNAYYNTNANGTGMTLLPGSVVTDSIILFVIDPDADMNCVSNSVTLVVNINPIPPLPIISSITCNGAIGSFIVLNPTGSEYIYQLDALMPQTSNMFSNIGNGAHNMLVTNNITGCENSISFSVNCDCATPATINLPTIAGSVCEGDTFRLNNVVFGGASTQVTITTNGTGSLSSSTSNVSPFNISYIPAASDVNNVISITFTSNDPDGAGPCFPQIVTFPLTVRNNPSANVTGDDEVCLGSDVTLIATGGVGYQWSNGGSINDTTTFTNILIPSTFSVTVTDGFGCRDTALYLVDIKLVNAGRDTTVEYCKSAITVVNLSDFLETDAQLGGIWKNGNDTIFNATTFQITDLPVGFTSLTYIVEDILCGRDTAILIVEMRDRNNAGTDNTLKICEGSMQNLNLVQALGNHDNGGFWETSFSGINLSNPSSVNVNALLSGNYLVRYIIAENGCLADTALINITINPFENAGSDVNISSCVGSVIDILSIVNTSNKTGIVLNPDNHIGLNGSVWTTNGIQSGLFTFYYVIQNSLPCLNDTARINISLQNSLNPGVDQTNTFCEGETLNLNDYIDVNADAGGTFFYQNQPIVNGLFTPAGSGSSFEFIYVVGDGVLCPKTSAIITLTKISKPNVSITGFDQICEGSCNALNINQASGGPASVYITASSIPSGISVNQEIILTNPIGTTDINICVGSDQPFSLNQWPANETVTFQIDSIVVESNKTCVFALNTNFDFETLPPLEFDINPVLCDNETFAIGGEVYSKTNPSGTVKVFSIDDIRCDTIYNVNVTFYPPSMGVFEASYCDASKIIDIGGEIFGINRSEGSVILENESVNGCDSLVMVQLNYTSFEAFDTLTYGCNVEDIKFTINSASHLGPYDISVNGTIQAPVLSLPYTISLLPGINTIVVANMEGCEETINLLVEDVSIPEVILSQQANPDGTSQLIVVAPNSIYDLTWSPASTLSCSDCTDPIALPLVTTTYTLFYLYGDDCSDSKQITVEVKEIVTDLPNIFSPNGDGSNDVFKILLSPEMKLITQFSIYDRWGSKVFSQSNIIDDANNNGWDGSYNGNFVSPGVYVYIYEIEYLNGKVETFSNTLTLIK